MWGRQSQDGGLHYLLYITIVLQVPPGMQKIYSMALARKPTARTKNMLPTFSPVNCSSFVAVEKKSFYKNAKFCLVWSQNVFVNHLKNKDTGPFKLA